MEVGDSRLWSVLTSSSDSNRSRSKYSCVSGSWDRRLWSVLTSSSDSNRSRSKYSRISGILGGSHLRSSSLKCPPRPQIPRIWVLFWPACFILLLYPPHKQSGRYGSRDILQKLVDLASFNTFVHLILVRRLIQFINLMWLFKVIPNHV